LRKRSLISSELRAREAEQSEAQLHAGRAKAERRRRLVETYQKLYHYKFGVMPNEVCGRPLHDKRTPSDTLIVGIRQIDPHFIEGDGSLLLAELEREQELVDA
jgi:hypothetical protein